MKRLVAITVLLVALLPGLGRAQSGGGGAPVASQHTVTGSLEGTHIFTGTKVASVTVFWSTVAARFLEVFDGTTVPGNGALVSAGGSASNLIWCQILVGSATAAGNQTITFPNPLWAQNGIVVAVSTNASGCTAITADGANDYIAAQVY